MMTDSQWFENLKEDNAIAMWRGVANGWWETVENGEPVPFAEHFNLSDFPENATEGHLLVKLGLFPSLTQARKNGKNKPLVIGEHRIKKPTGGMWRIIIDG